MTPIRILHIEDNRRDADPVRAILDAEGIACDVTRVDTHDELVAALDRGGFDVILGNHTVPSFDGLSALKIAVDKLPAVPFIFVSGTLAEEVVLEAVKNGATDYVPKQNLERLGACIRRAVREAEERAQRRRAEISLQDRFRELELLHKISQDILGSADLKTLLDRILRRIISFASFDLGVIRLLDKTRNALMPAASFGYRDKSNIRAHSVKSENPTAGRIQIASFAGHGAYVEEDVNAEPGLRTLKAEGARSAVIVPVEAKGEVIGTILLGSRTPTKFPPALVRTLEAIGSQMGVAVQKARLYDETQENLSRIRALHEIDLAITSTLDLGTILDVLLEKTERLLPHIAATTVRLLNKETGELNPIACRNLPEEEWKAATAQAANRDLRRLLSNGDDSPVAILNVQTDAGALAHDLLRKYGLVSSLRVPLTVENKVSGVITFFTSEQHEFGPEEIELLSTLAEQGAIAIQNAYLHEGTRRSLDQLHALHEIDKAIISTLDLGTVLNVLLEKIELFLPIAAATTVRLLNPQTGDLESLACRGLDEKEWKAQQQRSPHGRARRVIETKAPVTVRNIQADPQTYNPAIFDSRGLVSYLGVPLIAKEEALGVLSLYTNRERDFTQEEIEFLDTLGRQAALAIHNARLYQEATVREKNLRVAHEQLDALNNITVIASQSLDLKTVTQSVIQKITEIFDFDATRIHLYDERRDELLLSAHFSKEPERFNPVESFPKGQGIAGRVAESGEPLIFEDLTMEPLYESLSRSGSPESKGRRFFAALPIKSGRHFLGTLVCIGFAPRRLSAQEIQLLTSMAGQIAVAVENASLYQEIMKRADELQRKTWQLEKADKVKMEFLGLMSHELRTPLNVIMGYTDLLFDGALGEINAAQGNGLRAVMTQSKDLLTMVENIMVATNAEAGTLVARWGKISLMEFLDELQQSHSVPAGKEIKLSWKYPTDFSLVETDADRLRQILHNLISNAIKYTEKGTVTVTARLLSETENRRSGETEKRGSGDGTDSPGHPFPDSPIHPLPDSPVHPFSDSTPPCFVEFSVQDTGIGIAKTNLPLIFDMFHQVDSSNTRAYEGVGLGLYIARKLTELLGGTIEVESEINRGSTFTVTLPAQRTVDSKP